MLGICAKEIKRHNEECIVCFEVWVLALLSSKWFGCLFKNDKPNHQVSTAALVSRFDHIVSKTTYSYPETTLLSVSNSHMIIDLQTAFITLDLVLKQ